jgi:hypothetical protein
MVKYNIQSNISKSVHYQISDTIEAEDIDYNATVYEEIVLFDTLKIDLAIGKAKHTYEAKHGIVYFPLYLVMDDTPLAKVALFEIKNNELLSIMDEDDDVDILEKRENILPIVSKRYLEKIIKEGTLKKKHTEGKNIDTETEKENDNEALDQDNVFQVKVTNNPSSIPVQEPVEELFVKNTSTEIPDMLEEETEQDAKKTQDEFVKSDSNPWIQNFMTSHLYTIEDNEGGGDCFFAVIRDAFRSIGKDTTVQKLRDRLAREVTEDLYGKYRDRYLSLSGKTEELENDKKHLKQSLAQIKKRIQSATSKEASKELVTHAKELADQYKEIEQQIASTAALVKKVAFMKNIDSIDKLCEHIRSSSYWINDWGITTLEHILNIKMILLSEDSFNDDSLDAVLQCGLLKKEEETHIRPDFYIMAMSSGNRYKLITYRQKKIFLFREIPYRIKLLIINKCLEQNSGAFHLIKDFRDLKRRLGFDTTDVVDDLENEYRNADLYDDTIHFSFYSHSSGKPNPGEGSGEVMPEEKEGDFTILQSIEDWRRKLDDSWAAPFNLDNHRWNSVEHYVWGSQYKKGFPDFYLQFSLDSGSEISANRKVARAAVGVSGKLNGRTLRDSKIIPDADFHELGVKQRSVEERRAALEAKFSQNLDLKRVLKETKMAKLLHFVRGYRAVPDQLLMKLRREL